MRFKKWCEIFCGATVGVEKIEKSHGSVVISCVPVFYDAYQQT